MAQKSEKLRLIKVVGPCGVGPQTVTVLRLLGHCDLWHPPHDDVSLALNPARMSI